MKTEDRFYFSTNCFMTCRGNLQNKRKSYTKFPDPITVYLQPSYNNSRVGGKGTSDIQLMWVHLGLRYENRH